MVETLTCIGLIDCVYAETGCAAAETQEDFDVCVEGCYGRSIEASVMEFETYVSCLEGCPERDGDAATTDDDLVSDRCIYANCSDDQAACWFEGAGSGTCLGIFDCEDTCPEDDGSCLWQCYEAATPAAQAALMGLTNCADIECPEGSPETCVEDAIVGRCAIFAEMCLNN